MTTRKKVAKQSARQVVRSLGRISSYKPVAGINTVREVSAKGSDRTAIRTAARSARSAGASQRQVKNLKTSLRKLDRTTKASATNRTAARNAAKRASK